MTDAPVTIADSLANIVTEALNAHSGATAHQGVLGPAEIIEHLRTTRGALDIAERCLLQALRIRTRLQIRLQAAEARYEQAWAEASADPRLRGRYGDHAPRERYAAFDMECIDVKLAFNAAKRDTIDADGAADVLRTIHRGLDNRRRDLATELQAMSMEDRLSRS